MYLSIYLSIYLFIHHTFHLFSLAYPSIDPSYTLPQTYRAQVGTSSPPIQCPFPVGILSNEYEVIWFRGIKKLNSSDTKYEILSNFSLIIHNTDLSDTSSGYFCQINVRNENAIGKLNEVFTQYGPDSSLTIYGKYIELYVFVHVYSRVHVHTLKECTVCMHVHVYIVCSLA